MKVSKRLALSAVAVAGVAAAVPSALATPNHPAGGTGGLNKDVHCTDSKGNTMDGYIQWTPTTIWPPNHKMQDIHISYTDDDNDGDNISIVVTGVSDNQTTGGVEDPGSGNTGTDWQIDSTPGTATDPGTAKTTVQVRSERSGRDGSRIYSIQVQCTESGGNDMSQPEGNMQTGTATITVTVPHDQGNSPKD